MASQGASNAPSLPPEASPASAQSSVGSALWSSLIAPMKRFWEIPTIHLSTYYGIPNQPGRPGPVVAVCVERASALRTRSKLRQKKQQQHHQQQQQSKLQNGGSATPKPAKKGLIDYLSGVSAVSTRTDAASSQSSGTPRGLTSEEALPEIEGVLLVTPCAIERYHLSGLPSKRAALPDTITAFKQSKIAGGGRVFLCGTQSGKIFVLKSDLLDSMLIFDTQSALRPVSGLGSVTAISTAIGADIPPTVGGAGPSHSEQPPSDEAAAFVSRDNSSQYHIFHSGQSVDESDYSAAPMFSVRDVRTDIGIPSDGEDSPSMPSATESDESRKKNTQESSECPPSGSVGPSGFRDHTLGISAVAVKCSFANFAESVYAGNCKGEIYAWEVPSGKFLHCYKCPSTFSAEDAAPEISKDVVRASSSNEAEAASSIGFDINSNCYVAAMMVVLVSGSDYHLWVGYGNGVLAVFDIAKKVLVKRIETSGNLPVNAIDVALQLGIILVLSGNRELSMWSCGNFSFIKSYPVDLLTCGVPLSCLRTVEPDRMISVVPSCILVLGCTDGSICIRRLYWKLPHYTHDGPLPVAILRHGTATAIGSSGMATTTPTSTVLTSPSIKEGSGNTVGEVEDNSDTPTTEPRRHDEGGGEQTAETPQNSPQLQCSLLRHFSRDVEPKCPVTALWVDVALDTVFVGDASGIVATLLPIRYVLDSWTCVSEGPEAYSQHKHKGRSSLLKLGGRFAGGSAHQQLSSLQCKAASVASCSSPALPPPPSPQLPVHKEDQPLDENQRELALVVEPHQELKSGDELNLPPSPSEVSVPTKADAVEWSTSAPFSKALAESIAQSPHCNPPKARHPSTEIPQAPASAPAATTEVHERAPNTALSQTLSQGTSQMTLPSDDLYEVSLSPTPPVVDGELRGDGKALAHSISTLMKRGNNATGLAPFMEDSVEWSGDQTEGSSLDVKVVDNAQIKSSDGAYDTKGSHPFAPFGDDEAEE